VPGVPPALSLRGPSASRPPHPPWRSRGPQARAAVAPVAAVAVVTWIPGPPGVPGCGGRAAAAARRQPAQCGT